MEMNGQQKTGSFTCIGRSHGAPCLPATREEWERMRREPWLKQMCERIEKGDEELKRRLPVWTPHCAEFNNNHRAAADAVKPLRRLMMDFDEKGHTDEILRRLGILTLNDNELHELSGDGNNLSTCQRVNSSTKSVNSDPQAFTILLVEESVRRGTHVLVELPEGMTAEEAQQLMTEMTGFKPDAAVKDVARCIYMVTEEHTRFLDEEKLFKASPAPSEGGETSEQTLIPHPTNPHPSSLIPHPTSPSFKNIPYTPIIAEYWRRTGGVPQEGERNKRLHQLAANLRAICDDSEEQLLRLMPRYGLSEQEMRSIVHSACKEPTKGSKIMDEILRDLTSLDPSEGGEPQSEGRAIGDLKRRLPIGLKESLVGVPEGMQMPVLCAVLPIAAAYADQVEVEYCDGNRQRLGLMSIIRGDQASGKSVCKNAVDVWKRQLDEEDALARKREEEWKERKKGRKANEKAPEDPKVLIRMVPVTVSCSTLLKRLKNGGGHTLYSFCEELDTLRKTNGAGSWSSKYDIYRLGFDHGDWGQDYNSDQAESGVVQVAYNWTMLGTNGAMRKCFKTDNIENGLSSRILVAEMPDASFAKMPKYKRRSEDDEARIQEAVTLLRSHGGMVDTPRLRRAIEQWVEEKRVEAAKDIDHVKDTYRKRAAVIGFRCGVVFRLLEGKESNRCVEFALLMADYCLEQQIAAFGEALQNQYVEASGECRRYGKNHSVFDQLPPTFTIGDLRALKRGYCSDGAMRMIVFRWMRDGWITKTDRQHWSKTTEKPT